MSENINFLHNLDIKKNNATNNEAKKNISLELKYASIRNKYDIRTVYDLIHRKMTGQSLFILGAF